MPIPKRKVKVGLKQDTVSTVTPLALQKELWGIGLDCKYTSIENLTKFKSDVVNSWPEGGTSSTYGIYKKSKALHNANTINQLDYLTLENQSPLTMFGYSNDEIHGEWKPSDTAQGYREELFTIQYPEHFDYLLNNKQGSFPGVKSSKEETSKEGTVKKIKEFFVDIGTQLSSVVVNGLNKTSLEAVLVDAIGVNESSFSTDYEENNSRVIYLVQNYNETTEEADAIGVLAIDWKIAIKNYKEKKKELKHETKITMNVRSVLYSELDSMMVHYEFVKSHFKNNLFLLDGIPPRPTNIIVYDSLPPACKDTFLHSLPTVDTSNEYTDTIVLYAPNSNLLYALDNTESNAASTYSKSVTSGFTFSSSQTLSAELSFEAGCEVVKTGFKMGLNISFTEEWNESTTEEISITVPEGEMAYVYQGYMKSAILRFHAKTMSYEYLEKAKFLTNILKTTKKPVV